MKIMFHFTNYNKRLTTGNFVKSKQRKNPQKI